MHGFPSRQYPYQAGLKHSLEPRRRHMLARRARTAEVPPLSQRLLSVSSRLHGMDGPSVEGVPEPAIAAETGNVPMAQLDNADPALLDELMLAVERVAFKAAFTL